MSTNSYTTVDSQPLWNNIQTGSLVPRPPNCWTHP